MRDPGEFMSTLKVDLYPEEVYTFTPRGKVIVLPRDATPIDFAYAIHSDVGNTCVGAKVNGRIVPLRYALRNGDIVEILTQPGHLPSKDWLAIVKTSRARNKIKHVINANERVKAIEIGEKYLEKEARRLGVALSRDRARRSSSGWPASTAAARWRTCTRRWATASFRRGRCCRSWLPAVRGGAAPNAEAAGRSAAARRAGPGAPAERRRPGHPGQGHRRSAGLPRQVLQSDSRRSHRRIRTRGKGVAVHRRSAPTCRT